MSKPAENAAHRENSHLWMETNNQQQYETTAKHVFRKKKI